MMYDVVNGMNEEYTTIFHEGAFRISQLQSFAVQFIMYQ